MDKKNLLSMLEDKLRRRGINDDILRGQMNKIELFLNAETGDSGENGAEYINLDNIDEIADELFVLLSRFSNKPKETVPERSSAVSGDDNAADGTSVFDSVRVAGKADGADKAPVLDDVQTGGADITTVFDSVQAGGGIAGSESGIKKSNIAESAASAQTRQLRRVSADDAPPKRIELPAVIASPAEEIDPQQEYAPPEEASREEEAAAVPPPPPGTPLFWGLFVFASPFLLILSLVGALLFALGFFVLAMLIIGLFALLIAVAAAGTAVSLIDIIYGITQLFKYVPIGLCEIGIGIMLAGAVMLTGILIYNASVRLLPYLIKKLAKLLRITLKNIRRLYYFLKGECAKL